jgi:hypothetical protein
LPEADVFVHMHIYTHTHSNKRIQEHTHTCNSDRLAQTYTAGIAVMILVVLDVLCLFGFFVCFFALLLLLSSFVFRPLFNQVASSEQALIYNYNQAKTKQSSATKTTTQSYT